MRTRSFPIVAPLLLVLLAFTSRTALGADEGKATAAARPADALWHFNAHG